MKILIIIALCLTFIGCDQNSNTIPPATLKTIDIPDSVGNWYANIFDYPNYLKKITLTTKLDLTSLESDSLNSEIRVWVLGSMWNPKTVYSIKRKLNKWTISKMDYYLDYGDSNQGTKDSIYNIIKTEINITATDYDLLNLEKVWKLESQSKMKNGSNYGCMDGYSLLIELNSANKYKFLAYRCPDIHASKDSTFYFSYELLNAVQKITAATQ